MQRRHLSTMNLSALLALAIFIGAVIGTALGLGDPVEGALPTSDELADCACQVSGMGSHEAWRGAWAQCSEPVGLASVQIGSGAWTACEAHSARVEPAAEQLRADELERQVVRDAELRRMREELDARARWQWQAQPEP